MGLLRLLVRALCAPPRPSPTRAKRRTERREQLQRPKPAPARSEDMVPMGCQPVPAPPRVLRGRCYVIDGDTIVIDTVKIRLAGIDAPELEHPWGKKSKWALVKLCRDQVVTAQFHEETSHDRCVATCFLPDGRDLGAELVRMGLAVDWPKFSGGKYRHLEPPGIRRKLWRADARQKGRFPPPVQG